MTRCHPIQCKHFFHVIHFPLVFSHGYSFFYFFFKLGVASVASVVFIGLFSALFGKLATLHRPRSPPRVAFLILFGLPVEKH